MEIGEENVNKNDKNHHSYFVTPLNCDKEYLNMVLIKIDHFSRKYLKDAETYLGFK